MVNEEIARKTLSLEVKAAKVTGKLLLNLLKKLIKEAEKLGGLEKLVKVNGNEVKLKDCLLYKMPLQHQKERLRGKSPFTKILRSLRRWQKILFLRIKLRINKRSRAYEQLNNI